MVLIDVPAALALVSSVVCFLAAGIVFIRRERRPQAAGVLLIYLSVSFIWFLEQALRRMGQLDFLLKDFLDLVPFYGVLILAITFYTVAMVWQRKRRAIALVTGQLDRDQT